MLTDTSSFKRLHKRIEIFCLEAIIERIRVKAVSEFKNLDIYLL